MYVPPPRGGREENPHPGQSYRWPLANKITVSSHSRKTNSQPLTVVMRDATCSSARGARKSHHARQKRKTRYSKAMSQENVEIVKAVVGAINREDWDAAFQDAAPGFELDFSRALGPYRGVHRLDQARRFVRTSARSSSPFGLKPTSSSMPVSTWSFSAPSIFGVVMG
jgi:hypothetical protein